MLFAMCLTSAVLGSMLTVNVTMNQVEADDKDIPKRIEAHEFVLVDADGANRARLGFSKRDGVQQPYLNLTDDRGFALLSVAVDKNGVPFMRLNNPDMPPMALRQRRKASPRLSSSERIPYSERQAAQSSDD
jgi:hypothetical protein